jgi:glycogen(starch) synthase
MATLFEVSWEVCNKVGGIYTVVRSKVPFIKEHYSEYVLIGPAFEQSPEFDERPVPERWRNVLKTLEGRGVRCRYGTWMVPGEPTTILVDFHALFEQRNAIKAGLWERYGIDSLKSAWEFDEPMCFATAAGMVIEEYAKEHDDRIIAQCHEWISGFALLHLNAVGAKVGTVFTTHATMLGRTIAGNGHPLYDMLSNINPAEWAYRLGVQDKHLTEVACAKTAHVFTTVSEITGLEAEKLLGRKPDVLLYNGFFIDKFPTFEETSLRHYHSKELLREFTAYMFFPHYVFDLEKTLFFFTSGRYEYQNKGLDMIVDALAELNRRLKEERSDVTVVMIFWVIMGRAGVRHEVLERKNFYEHIKSAIEWQSKSLQQKLILDFLSGHKPGEDDLFTSSFIRELHEDIKHFRRPGDAPLVTHDGPGESDPIIARCKAVGLDNQEEDRVKVIIYPGYLDGSDGVLNLQYYDATVGAHLGIFPSLYEPWGYTPLESAVLGVPAITTDLAGFGRYIKGRNLPSENGVYVLKRMGVPYNETVRALVDELHKFTSFDHAERVQRGYSAKTLASLCDWKNFAQYYLTAHNMALERAK